MDVINKLILFNGHPNLAICKAVATALNLCLLVFVVIIVFHARKAIESKQHIAALA